MGSLPLSMIVGTTLVGSSAILGLAVLGGEVSAYLDTKRVERQYLAATDPADKCHIARQQAAKDWGRWGDIAAKSCGNYGLFD